MYDVNAQTTLQTVMLTVFALLLIAIFAGSIVAFVRAIWGFITSGGDEEKITASWSSIRFMITGIVLSLILLFFFPILLEKIGTDSAGIYTAKNVFARAGEIINWFLSLPLDVSSSPFSTKGDYSL